MEIHYTDGPPSVTLGAAGTFKCGESRDVDDKLAQQILKKTSIVFKEGAPDSTTAQQPAAEEHPTEEVNDHAE